MDNFFSFFSVDNVLLQLDGRAVSYLEALSVIAGLSCVFLAVRAKVFNFFIGYIYSILLFTLFFQKNLYSSMMLQPISLVINAIGHYRWTHPRKNEENKKHELKITLLTNQQRILILAILAGLTLGWGFAMAHVNVWMPWPVIPSKLPYLDAFVVMTILTAQWLSAQKKLDCWAVWMTVNITNVTLYTLRGLVFMPFLSATYIVMVFFGSRIWYKKYKNDKMITNMNNMLLEIKNLHASIGGREILKGINLTVKQGEVHAIMGPNGSGKSTLSVVLAGRENYEVSSGSVVFNGENLLTMPPEERSHKGLFLGFQYPVEIPGVSNVNFMKAAINEHRKYNGQEPLSAADFLKLIREKMAIVEMDAAFSARGVNVGFSGGEKKRNEIFQMAMLEPKLAILDETDSGLDVDALRIVASGVNKLKRADNAFIVITHYQRLLDYIVPDIVHVLYDGKIVKTAGKELALEVEQKGYDWLK